jgi:hypothetical protein
VAPRIGSKDRQQAVVSELHDQGFTRDDAIEAICQVFSVPRGAAWWFVVWHPAWVAEAPAGESEWSIPFTLIWRRQLSSGCRSGSEPAIFIRVCRSGPSQDLSI